MKADKSSMLLYAVTDRAWLGQNSLAQQVEEAIKAGATFIQLREKDIEYDDYVRLAIDIKKVTDKYGIPFVIDDNVDVALASNADGVHVGQSDMTAGDVRSRIGRDKILGVSVQTVEQALLAEKNGADYLGVGAVFSTTTKQDAKTVSFNSLREICGSVHIPVVAIGGINEKNILELSGTGIAGVAVVSAIFAQKNISEAARKLADLSKQMLGAAEHTGA